MNCIYIWNTYCKLHFRHKLHQYSPNCLNKCTVTFNNLNYQNKTSNILKTFKVFNDFENLFNFASLAYISMTHNSIIENFGH